MRSLLPVETLIAFIKKRHPELTSESFSVDNSGWSNLVLIVGGRFVFRFPRTDNAKKNLQIEQRILPGLSPFLPVPIPQFRYSSNPTDEIIYVGYPLIKGEPLLSEALVSFSSNQKEQLAHQLGAFLTALHTYPLEKAFPSTIKAHDIKKSWQKIYETIHGKAYPYMETSLKTWTDHVFHRFLSDTDSFSFSPCLLHNDFKPAHILFDPKQRVISGVIDFGSMWAGDPAYDLVGMYNAYGERFAAQVIRYYGAPIDDSFFHRINGFYLKIMSFWKLLHGIETKNHMMVQSALEKLRIKAQQDNV